MTESLKWYDAQEWEVQGKGWENTHRHFDRLPPYAEAQVTEDVWNLSRFSAGLYILFETDASEIHARWSLSSPDLAKNHMPASSVSGLDLYALDENDNWRWVAIGLPASHELTETSLISGMASEQRSYRLYLPLFNGVETLEIGIPSDATLTPSTSTTKRPVVIYGTSIVHGASASRPGTCYTARLGRRFDNPVINLGFAGRAKMESAIADLLAEIDACVYVLDCVPNMTPDLIEERLAEFVRKLSDAKPSIPIVMVEDRTYANSWIVLARHTRNIDCRQVYRDIFKSLTREGLNHLHYVSGEALLGDDCDATVDGSHPTDLGFYRMADALEKVIAPLL